MDNKRNVKNDKKSQKILKLAVVLAFGAAMIYEPALLANAATNVSTITNKFNILKDIVTAILSSIGMVVCLWGIFEWGMAFQGQDGTMQAQSFKRIAGGLIMILAPQILTILT